MSLGDCMYNVVHRTSTKSNDELSEIYKKMPFIRQKKADALKHDIDRANCIIAWSVLDELMTKNGINIYDYKYEIGENGKPYLVDCPLYFSISHSGDSVAVAVADSDIGVDIQYAVDDYEKIAKRVCTDDELMVIMDKYDFVRIWTMKEATVKCTGVGIADMKKYDSLNKDDSFVYDTYDGGEYYIVECKKGR